MSHSFKNLRQRSCYVFLLAFVLLFQPLAAHHYKGLPHYAYFENYPQVPVEEFLGQAGEFEISLVVYDFQGLTREDVEQPDDVRLFLIIFNLLDNRVYSGPLEIEVLNGSSVLEKFQYEAPEEENIYRINARLTGEGDYSLKLYLKETGKTSVIPFRLSSQKINWTGWVAGILLLLLVVTAVGSRRARILKDKKKNQHV